MAGNIQADNSGNVLVEFDYNNIIVVDPNKTIDAFGKIQERLIDHEKLVMYANLEAEVLPRTKLAVGGSPQDRVRIISVAKIDFLKPTKEDYLGTGYYDELTGENTTKYKGQNQILQKGVQPKDGSKPYISMQPADLNNIIDNGLLGITSIEITTNTSFVPTVRIALEDVQGKALFQLGNNSPYAAFFNLPYPQFYLTLKGFYGQAIRYQLNLEKFNARFNTFSGNYQIDLDFKGYKFNILNEISMGHLLAVPHMYGTRFDVKTAPIQSQQNQNSISTGSNNSIIQQGLPGSNSEGVSQIVAKKGYQKIVEVYSEYKAKGLIPPDFPELTLFQLMTKFDMFEQNITNSFTKAEVEPLTNIRTYKDFLKQYFNQLRGSETSWFNKFLNPRPLILLNGDRVYVFKENLDKQEKDTKAIPQLNKIIDEFNRVLSENATLGVRGPSPIVNPIKYQLIVLDNLSADKIDWVKTTQQQTAVIKPTDQQIIQTQSQYTNLFPKAVERTPENQIKPILPTFFIFEGAGRFDKEIARMEAEANKKLASYEAEISDKLLRKIEDKATGIGFKPTVRGILAVIMASTEAFIRLMDDVHTNAWAVKYDPVRKRAILENPSSAPSSDSVDDLKLTRETIEQSTGLKYSEIPVYPWPQFFKETPEDKKGRFQLVYIADPSVVDDTQGYLYDKWPEVEFVEEYMVGLTQKFDPPAEPPPLDNERDTNRLNINAIEFPNIGISYANKEEIKFFYEIWERQFLTSRYSNLIRANQSQINELIKLNVETEVNNITKGLGVSSPFLALKLKNFNLTSSNYEEFLKGISNFGTGRAYQDFIRDFFVTPYIKNITENSFGLLNALDLGKIPQTSTKSDALLSLLTNASNEPNIVDTIPFTDYNWSSRNLADGQNNLGSSLYNTNKTLKVFEPRKIIANFSDTFDFKTNRPVTNFSYLNNENPIIVNNDLLNNDLGLAGFYETREPTKFVPTEGYCYFTSPSNQLPFRTTTSMLNTPYFVNSILNGVYNNRRNDPYPYVQSAYLFLNSLPVATLKEKYKTLDGATTKELDYIASCFKKFGAIHKIPYVWILKLGSNWHRYKKFKETGIDFLKTCWTDFDYIKNYSPISGSASQTYGFKYQNEQINITLQKEESSDIDMNVGFYPKLITDFNYFFTGYDLYSTYTDEEIQKSIDLGVKVYNFKKSNIESANQGTKKIRLQTWSVLVPKFTNTSDKNCDTKDNTFGIDYFVVPSFGSQINQTLQECFTNLNVNPQAVTPITSNNSVFNGSVRALWSTPNYGYFDNKQIAYPSPETYVNKFDMNQPIQTPFSLLNTNEYSKIEEIFSVFEKRILDLFEEEFLKFSKPVSDAQTGAQPAEFLESNVNLNANFRNFQSLFRSLMVVPAKKENVSDTDFFQDTINVQNQNFITGIQSFIEYDLIFKYGNPSNYKRRIWDSYLSYLTTPKVTDPITFEPYLPNSLPSKSGGVTLNQSKINNREAWLALELEVGFSTISGVSYSNLGSYITDFFIENNIKFTAKNVTVLASIIKIWATQKLNNPTLTVGQFKNLLTSYLNEETNLQNVFLDSVLNGVRAALPYQQQLPEKVIKSAIQGEISKVENYEMFKALNDKWIAGGDYTTKTLFEDMLFLDRASRNIGETIILDIFDLKNMFSQSSLNQVMSVFTFMSGILIKNNFTVMNLPAYVNFYNIQNLDGTTIPQSEGSLEFANNMWGTFLDVDYRNSGPKMVCFFVGKPSQYLDLPKGNFRFRDDGFELARASENPLIENQKDKKDWGLSNKCVGFNVDIGTRNQNVFYSFSVSQDSGVATSESINTQLNMVNQASGRNVATQNISLYNLYKQRSYKCDVVSLGNALIQPTMYFNLRHVPMFNGPYMITNVSHSIQPGTFQTSFQGIRQGIYDLPAIDNFLQSINQNLLTKLEELLKIEKDKTTVSTTTENAKASDVVQKSDNKIDASNSCTNNVDLQIYRDYTVTTARQTSITPAQLVQSINKVVPNEDDFYTRLFIYSLCYIKSFVENGNSGVGNFVGYNNNFANISLYNNFNPTASSFFEKTYCCISVKSTSSVTKSEPLVSFKDLDTFVKFLASRIERNKGRIKSLTISKYYVCYWPFEFVSESEYDSNPNRFAIVRETMSKAFDSAVNAKLIKQDESKEEKKLNKVIQEPEKTPTVTPRPGQTCPPPVINSFAPRVGNTGTIIQINGTGFENVTGISINNVIVDMKTITFANKTTLRVSVPQMGVGNQVVTGQIILKSEFGDSVQTNLSLFTYQPGLPANNASSPGSTQNGANAAVAANNSNTNPQSTGPLTLIGTTVIQNQNKTQSLNVKVNPQLNGWSITPIVDMYYVVHELYEQNGQVKRKLVQQSSAIISNQVVNNQFNIGLDYIINNNLINYPKYEGKTEIDITFVCKATSGTLQPVVQQFPFKIYYTQPNQTTVPVDNVNTNQTLNVFKVKPISIVKLADYSDTMVGAGPSYFNVKKPGGGYIPLQLTLPPGDQVNVEWIEIKDMVDISNNVISSQFEINPNNKTFEVTVSGLGPIKLKILYLPYGNTQPPNGQVLKELTFSPTFIL